MKKYFLSAILSAAVLFASCGVGNDGLSGNTEASETTSVTSQTTGTTSEMQTSETVTTEPQTNEMTSETIAKASLSLPKDQDKFIQESPISDYYDGINYIKIPLSYEGKEIYLDNACHEVINGLEYEDFPAKEDIAPAIEFAFENYFKDAMVCYMDGDPKGEPCTVDCLSFDTGLYLDFDGDGENESL
ncbi:MAG: hypothetical protein J1E40_05275, partial [Oscillospiraceae bacterium]|nr:hypothetical protein [Oscillospiraceae bacterium]